MELHNTCSSVLIFLKFIHIITYISILFLIISGKFSAVQSLSRVQLCNPMDCSTPGLPVHHQLPEFTQTHVHWVSDAIQLSYPLSSPSLPTFNLSQHQGLFKWFWENLPVWATPHPVICSTNRHLSLMTLP